MMIRKTFFIFFMPIVLQAQDSPEALLDSGYQSYLDDNCLTAIRFYNKALKMDSANAEAYFLRGICRSILGKPTEAMKDFDTSLRLNPNYADPYYEKAIIYLSNQNALFALDALNKVLSLDSTRAEAYVSRGTAKCMLEDKKGAEEDWAKAKELGVAYTEYMICE